MDEDGYTVWLPLDDLEPDQPPDALHVTGLVAPLLILHDNVTLCPLVMEVELALKLRVGATALGADGEVGCVGVVVGGGVGVLVGGGVVLPLDEVDVGGGVVVVVDDVGLVGDVVG